MKSIEVEIRGPLTERQYQKLRSFLRKRGKLLAARDQQVIFFHYHKHNLSLKKDHEKEKIVIKLGKDWQKESRQETEVHLEKGQFANALTLLKHLGFTKGYCAPAWREDYLYRRTQISLKTKCVIGPHYEMEKTVTSSAAASALKKRLMALAKELELKVWSEKEYRRHTHQMWQAHHPGPEIL